MLLKKEVYLKYFEGESKENFINIDINIFDQLSELMGEDKLATDKQRTFAFAYYCLITYLWKYSKYGGSQTYSVADIKNILLISESTKVYDHIIKRDGVLDNAKFTETTRDLPIATVFDEFNNIQVQTLSSLNDKEYSNSFLERLGKRFYCKKPLHQYERDGKEGLLYSRDDAFQVTSFEIIRFLLCKELSFDAFYLYMVFKLKFKMVKKDTMVISSSELEKYIGYKSRKINELVGKLVHIGAIENTVERIKDEKGKFTTVNYYKFNGIKI